MATRKTKSVASRIGQLTFTHDFANGYPTKPTVEKLYDVATRSLLVNKQKIADRSSRMELKQNADGSVDIFCGPKAPKGFESKNWIPTVPGKAWFSYFHLYEPTQRYFDKSWPLGDFVALKGA